MKKIKKNIQNKWYNQPVYSDYKYAYDKDIHYLVKDWLLPYKYRKIGTSYKNTEIMHHNKNFYVKIHHIL